MHALDRTAFAACMAPFEPFEDEPFLAIAVSGGADSLALTLLANAWARRRGGRVVGLTVDHCLRSGSADEAHQAGHWLQARKIEHHILTWTGEKPQTGLQRRARDARYALLTDWCRQRACFHLLTAHHRGDQAETVALRKARQSGGSGLAAMAAMRDLPGLRLLRPLLGIDKAALEDSLRAVSQDWLDDPSNANPAFTRNRLRQNGLDVEALAKEAERQGCRRQTADRQVAAALVQHARIDPAGFATLDPTGFGQLPEDLACEILTRLLMTIGGRIYPPRKDALIRLFQAMRGDVATGRAARPSRTLAHCRILEYRSQWLICRERMSCLPLFLVPGRRQLWEDRFVVTLRAPMDDLSIRAIGNQARSTLISKGKTRRLPAVIKAQLPGLWLGERLMAIPHLGLFEDAFAPETIELRFCPKIPLAKAPFMPHITP